MFKMTMVQIILKYLIVEIMKLRVIQLLQEMFLQGVEVLELLLILILIYIVMEMLI